MFLLRYIITLDTKFGCITVSHHEKNEQNKKAPVETSPQHMQVCPVIFLVPKYYQNNEMYTFDIIRDSTSETPMLTCHTAIFGADDYVVFVSEEM